MSITETSSYDLEHSPDSLDFFAFVRKFAVYEETEMLKLREVETIHINHLTRAADLRTFPRLVESPQCRARQ